jgi:hypothetical protein
LKAFWVYWVINVADHDCVIGCDEICLKYCCFKWWDFDVFSINGLFNYISVFNVNHCLLLIKKKHPQYGIEKKGADTKKPNFPYALASTQK